MNFLKKINIENLQKVLIETFVRFPLSFLISTAVLVLFVTRIALEDLPQNIENIFDKSLFTLVLTFFFSIGIYLFGESKKLEKLKQWSYQLISVVFGISFYSFFEENLFENFSAETAVYIAITFVGILSFVFIAPFILKILKKEVLQKEFYICSYHLIIKTLMSMIVGLASMILGFIGLWAIFELFELKFLDEENIYSYWASFTLSFFAPVFFLANIPNIKINIKERIEDNKFYAFLIKYVGLPAITLYFVILYAYTIKVLFNFSDWPQGKITWMVIGFSFFGYLIYFATYIFKEKFKPAEIFRKIFTPAVLPQIAMLFYAIFLRINQYDFTINRYLVVVFGIWLLGLSLYYVISKRKFLGVIFYSLLFTTIFISIGPWSVYVFPENRQKSKLVENLIQANILQDDKIVPLKKYEDIEDELSGKIYGSIDYLCDFHGCETVGNIFSKEISEIKTKHKKDFEEQKKEDLERTNNNKKLTESFRKEEIKKIKEKKYREINRWNLKNQLTEKIKVRAYYSWRKDKDTISEFLHFKTKESSFYYDRPIKVSGYDYYLKNIYKEDRLPNFSNIYKEESEIKILNHLVSIDIVDSKLTIFNQTGAKKSDRKNIETFDLKNIFSQVLAVKEGKEELKNQKGYSLENDDLTFELDGEKFSIKIHFNSIMIPNPAWKPDTTKEENGKNNKIIIPAIEHPYVSGEVWIKDKSD